MADEYAGERYDPKIAMCKSRLSLLFNGTHLIMTTDRQIISFRAVSGRSTPQGFIYTSSRQQQKGVGPIPEGVYWIKPSELWTNAWHKIRSPRSSWGNYRITIHPFTTTETYGRGGFFVHGGDLPGSAGCIDLASEMDSFVKRLLEVIGPDQLCQIHLTVKYPAKGDFFRSPLRPDEAYA